MTIDKYFESIAKAMETESNQLRESFYAHRPSAGSNRESIVANFLRSHLQQSVGVSTGLVLSSDGVLSKQADVVVSDVHTNAPLHSNMPDSLWLVESVYAMIEVKTSLSPTTLGDAVAKCRRFKALNRNFSPLPARPRIEDSLFIIWAFESPSAATLKKNLASAILEVPKSEQPDIVIVAGQLVATAGAYFQLAKLGQQGSQYRKKIEASGDIERLEGDGFDVWDLGPHSLMAFTVWLNSWLCGAGTRTAPLASYIPAGNWGQMV